MRTTKLAPILVALTMVAVMAIPAIAAPQMQAGNLLLNPSFENGIISWNTWYYENLVNQEGGKYPDLSLSLYAPYFQASEPKWDKEGDGNAAGAISGQQSKKFRGGFYQEVNAPAGARVRFSGWGNGFCLDDKGNKCDVILKLGIDPDGGTNWGSGTIQWSGEVRATTDDPKKYLQLATGEVTVGPGGKVTVFTWGENTYEFFYNAAYFDDMSLVVTAAPPPTTPTAAAPAPAPAPAQPAAPAQPPPCAQLRWVADVTIPDGTPIAPGAQFVKTWKVKNNGTCAFSGTLSFVGKGNQMGGASPVTLPKIDPGQQADISINLTAPAQVGDYQGTWQPRMSDGTLMENLVVQIKVQANAPAPIAAVTATPQGQLPPTAEPPPTPTTGQICIQAYNDRNGDSQQGTDENLLAGVIFTLSDADGPRESYTTDGVSEPHCFPDLQPGSYSVSAKPPANYSATTEKTTVVALNGGMKTDISFGARRGGPVPTPTKVGGAGASGGSAGSSLLGSAGRVILIVVLVLILIGLGFGGGFLLMSRR